jgi:hypothetical protein
LVCKAVPLREWYLYWIPACAGMTTNILKGVLSQVKY